MSRLQRVDPPADPPPPAAKRTAFGEYIPLPGGKPLTALALSTPGPADYDVPDMKLNKSAAPEFSIRLRAGDPEVREQRPSPASYTAKLPTCKKPLMTTMKSRFQPPDYRCSPGPVHMVRVGDLDTKPGRVTIKGRNVAGSIGHPSPLDPTSYTETPAPVYSAVTAHLPAPPGFKFNSQPPRRDQTPGPGPGKRNMQRPLSGPEYTMRPRHRKQVSSMNNPPPDWYFVQDVRPAVHAPMFGQKLRARRASPRPAPNTYKLHRTPRSAPTLTFRPFEPELEQPTPGPGAYSPEMPSERRAPAFSIGLPVMATYPSQERHPSGRGPASYNTRSAPAERPAFKLTRRPKDKHENFPAPNSYSPHPAPGTNKGFSLRIRHADQKLMKAPGPNKYLPERPLPTAPAYTLHDRQRDPKYKQKESVPSPATYYPPPECGRAPYQRTGPGASLKSRQSRYVFTGLDRARLPGAMSEQVERKRVPIV